MAAIGFHASHEQVPPSVLLHAVAEAEAAGFERACSSDHFSPWSERQGESDKAVRNARLRECVDVIRALFAGEAVDHDGLVTVDRAKLWMLPAEPPPLLATAVSADTCWDLATDEQFDIAAILPAL